MSSRRGTPAEDHVFGIHAVEEALARAPGRVVRILIARRRGDARVRAVAGAAREAGVPVQWIGPEELARRFRGATHQGVVARVAPLEYVAPDRLVHAPDPRLILVLDGVLDAGNLGAVLRTAAASGASGVCLPRHRSAGLGSGVERASAGTASQVPVARVANVGRFLDELREEGVQVFAVTQDGDRHWFEPDYGGATAVVLGGEQKGLRPGVVRHCDERVRIAMAAGIESLNVAAAAAIIAFEVVRQRLGAQSQP